MDPDRMALINGNPDKKDARNEKYRKALSILMQ